MFNADMRKYEVSRLGAVDEYGQMLPLIPSGEIKMCINVISQVVTNNVIYSSANYIGLTHEDIDNTFVIHYGEQKLKVLYVYPKGRLKQVFMGLYE